MAIETYVLLESMNADAPVYQTLQDGTRMQITKIRSHRPTLRQDFQDENGVGKVIRYKIGSQTIDQRVQIDKEKIEANARFTSQENKDLEFNFGVLVTNKLMVQEYLKAHPEMDGFTGYCDDVRSPRYKLLDEAGEQKIKNTDTRKRIKAANKIIDLDLEAAVDLLIRLNGSFFTTPTELEECQNLLISFVDDAEEAGLDAILKEDKDTTVDEKTTVLIGKLINAKVLFFDAVEGKILKVKDGKQIELRDMSGEYSLEERKRLFSDFLNSNDGKDLKFDLQKDLEAFEKKPYKEKGK